MIGPRADFLSAALIFLRVLGGECARNRFACLSKLIPSVLVLSITSSCGAALVSFFADVVSSETGKPAQSNAEPGLVTHIHS